MGPILDELGLDHVQPTGLTPAGLRAGCATHLFICTQDIALVKWRGRWQSDKTLEHYLQELGSCSLLATLPQPVRDRIEYHAKDARPLLDAVIDSHAKRPLEGVWATNVRRKL